MSYCAKEGGKNDLKADEQTRLYQRDVAILKDYGIKRKLTIHKAIRARGFETSDDKRPKGEANEQKLDENIIRAKSRIFELAYCNPWKHFVTLTMDPKKHNRHDLERYMKTLAHWIRNYNTKWHLSIKYLLIPEMHKDGAWHIHGFLMGLPDQHLVENKNGYLDWIEYREKFGWMSVDKIRNHEAVSKYVTKYISKNLSDCVKEVNAHMYYCSQGLKRAEEIKRGTLMGVSVPWDYENDWIKCRWSDAPARALESLIL